MRAAHFLVLLLIVGTACGNRLQQPVPVVSTSANFCSSPQRIQGIYRDFVYDLEGYDGIAGNSPFNLFDEAAMVDPKGNGEYHPVTSPHPVFRNRMYYRKGNRIVIDLRVPYKVSEIYVYDHSREQDSFWIYTGTMKAWKQKAAMVTKGDISQWGWRKIPINDSTRFVMIKLNSWEADIREAVFYGCAYQTPPPVPEWTYKGERLPAKTVKEFLGVNSYQTVPRQWLAPFYTTRVYTPVDLFDRDTVHEYPNQQYDVQVHGWYNNGVQDYTFFPDSVVRYSNARIWYSLLGVPYYLKKQGKTDRDRPVTTPGMDTESPYSYARHGNLLWNIAALYGAQVQDTNQIQIFNRPRFTARNVLRYYENGNEVDANWESERYSNPVEYFAMSSADWDGHENTMGPRIGLKHADSNALLVNAGFVSLDTNRLKTLAFLSRNLRNDGQFLWKGGIQYHMYSFNGKGRFQAEDFAHSTRALSPEEDSVRWKLTKVRNTTYRFQPGVECILGEYGYDKYQGSKNAVPMVKGYDARQSQAIMLLRGINAVAFSGFDRLLLYWIKDDSGEGEPGYDGVFLSSGLVHQKGSTFTPYPSWYFISTLVQRLGDYYPEKIISEKGNVWIYRYRHRMDRSRAAYFVYAPTYNGTVVDNYSLDINTRKTSSAMRVQFNAGNAQGNEQPLAVQAGKVSLKVTEVPQLVFVQE